MKLVFRDVRVVNNGRRQEWVGKTIGTTAIVQATDDWCLVLSSEGKKPGKGVDIFRRYLECKNYMGGRE